MNLQEELKALKERIAELEELTKEEQEFPRDGDKYWYIGDEGDILNESWDGLDFEEYRLAIGNIFKTKEQAEFAVEKLKVEAELRKYSRPFKKGKNNWIILFDSLKNRLEISWSGGIVHPGAVYFEDKTEAVKAVYSVGGDRIKKYIFGVE